MKTTADLKNAILLGDSAEVLKEFPDACLDACVTDPPYGLGTRQPTGPEIDAYLNEGSRLDSGGDFMGKDWDMPSVPLWREVYRAMKPGAILMAFAGTRTLDLMAAGIQAAGFKYIGLLSWCYGQGFPKSLDISKAIDKAAGHWRGKAGEKTGFKSDSLSGPHYERSDKGEPVTEEAKKWKGWGTALKPAWEPVLVFSKEETTWKMPWPPFLYNAKASKSETSVGGEIENNHPCLHPDALVMTENGYRPIRDVSVGSRVLSADGHFHAVEAVTSHIYTSENLVDIQVQGSKFTTLASDNHLFLVWRPTRKGNAITSGFVVWLRADEMQKGDYTMTPLVNDQPERDPPLPDDTEFWFLVGLYLAEGWPTKAGHGENVYPTFSLHRNETDLIEHIQEYCQSVKVSVYPNGDNGVTVMAFDPDLGSMLRQLCGSGAGTKSIDPCVWGLPDDSLSAFVRGYMAGDGGLVRDYLQAKTASRDMASQLRFMGERLGYKAELQWYPPEPGQIGDRQFLTTQVVHVLRLYSRNQQIEGRKPSKPTYVEHEGATYMLTYVKSVARVPYEGDVINLSVEGSPSFQTAVGMSHNTKKPVEVMEWLVNLAAKEGELVLDPFLGSGTTAAACRYKDRLYVGIERDPHFHGICTKRLGEIRGKNTMDGLADLWDELPQE